jgi:hypothetical protein
LCGNLGLLLFGGVGFKVEDVERVELPLQQINVAGNEFGVQSFGFRVIG